MENNLVSVICCFNKKDVLDKMLYKSLESQNIACEFLPIDNSDNQFDSAAAALNYGANLSKGKYLIFVHQDIAIENNIFIESLVEYFDSYNPCVLGFAGRKEDLEVYTNMTHGDNHKYAGRKRVSKPVTVQTLDECFIAIERELFLKYKFDETTCDNWHLYAVDLCLSCGKDGIKSYVIPERAYHRSSGVINRDYFKTLNKLVAKHRKDYDQIFSTCSIVKTDRISFSINILKRNVRYFGKRLLYKIR